MCCLDRALCSYQIWSYLLCSTLTLDFWNQGAGQFGYPLPFPACPVLNSLQILMPELASLRVAVMEEGNKFLGHRIIPISALNSGKVMGPLLFQGGLRPRLASGACLEGGAASGRWS